MADAPQPDDLGTQDRLIDAAARVFVKRGFAGATVREIAEAAGFTNPVLYYHFGSKDRLYQAVIEGSFERFEELTGEALETSDAPLERLRAFVAACLTYARLDPIRLRILHQEVFRPVAGEGSELDERLQTIRTSFRAQIAGLLAELDASGRARIRDLPLAARLLHAVLGGLLMEQAREPDQPLIQEELANAIVEVFLHGIEGPGEEAR